MIAVLWKEPTPEGIEDFPVDGEVTHPINSDTNRRGSKRQKSCWMTNIFLLIGTRSLPRLGCSVFFRMHLFKFNRFTLLRGEEMNSYQNRPITFLRHIDL